MFGLLKKKLSKAIKSISEKVKEKEEVEEKEIEKEHIEEVEEKIEEIEKKVEEIAKEVEEAIEPVKKEEPIDGVLITYFVHGTTTDNEKDIATGWVQGELSELGIKQANELGELVKDKTFDVVFCSDLKRAVDSANLAFKDKYKIIQDDRFREVNYGDFTQKSSKEFKPRIMNYVNKPFPNGESYKDVEQRIADFLNYLYDNYYGKHVAIVAHQAPQLALDVLLRGKTWERAIKEDWRIKKEWQPGWEYQLKNKIKLLEKKPIKKPVIEKPKKKSFIKKAFERVTKKFVERKLDETDLLPVLAELETDLIESDVAVETAERIKATLLKELTDKEIKRGREKDAIIEAFRKSLMDTLTVPEIDLKKIAAKNKPIVLLFIGFNGSGKTTSIAKLANWLKEQRLTCVLAAADTFRAASLEQLGEHADKIGVRMVKHKYGADPAAVVYDAIMHAKAKGLNFVLADTAGRVHTNQDLMEEMKKIIRVNKPDLKILVIDSLTGNDAVLQARAFGELDVDAVIFTKVDVNEKGGAILSVTNELKKPILFLGLGQEYGDFERFDAEKFVNNLLT